MTEILHIDFQKTMLTNTVPAIVRLAVWHALNSNGYLKPGAWVQTLHAADLKYLLELADTAKDTADDNSTAVLIALAMVLTQAEGIEIADGIQLMESVNQMVTFITFESLARKGLVTVIHNNMSFDRSADNLPIGNVIKS